VAALQNAAGNFVTPTAISLDAALSVATTNPDGSLTPDYSSTNPDAYPMPDVIYAAVSTDPASASQAIANDIFGISPPTTAVLIPSDGATQSGRAALLDATASANATRVTFKLTGGPDNGKVVAAGHATLYGWVGYWNTTKVPNGTYTLRSVASSSVGVKGTSAPITITVDNPPPKTKVVLPSNNASVSGSQSLDATATSGVTQVDYEVSGGPENLTDDVVATGTPTLYGWLASWNTTGVANGTYTLQSVASYGGGVSGTSAPITITVSN
jgi:hypothetical protein